MPKKPPLETRIARWYAQRLSNTPHKQRQAVRKVLIINGALVSLAMGLICAVTLAMFLMGLGRGFKAEHTQAAFTMGALCVACGVLSWVGWLMNRVGKKLRW